MIRSSVFPLFSAYSVTLLSSVNMKHCGINWTSGEHRVQFWSSSKHFLFSPFTSRFFGKDFLIRMGTVPSSQFFRLVPSFSKYNSQKLHTVPPPPLSLSSQVGNEVPRWALGPEG